MAELNQAPILDQTREHWQKLAALVLWKVTQGKSSVTLTAADMKAFMDSELIFVTHGHYDSIEFKLVTPEQARALVAHNETMKGNA